MALIDVPAKMFDPAQRREALEEAAAALGADVSDEQYEQIESVLDSLFPSPPEDVADYLDVLGRYVAILAVGSNLIGTLVGDHEARLAALEA
jgi:hypothetical protein